MCVWRVSCFRTSVGGYPSLRTSFFHLLICVPIYVSTTFMFHLLNISEFIPIYRIYIYVGIKVNRRLLLSCRQNLRFKNKLVRYI